MGLISTIRGALSPQAVRQALRSSSPATPVVPPSRPEEPSKPIPRLGRKGPPNISVLPPASPYQNIVEYNALDAKPSDWFAKMKQADYGHTGPMIDTFADARDRDAHLDGLARKRAQSLMGRPINFPPAEGLTDDKEAQQIAKLTRRILLAESREFRSMLAHLMTGAPYGYAVSPLRWTTNATGEYVPHITWAHCNRFAFTYEEREIGYYTGRYRTQTNVRKLSDFPDCFVAHVPMGGRSDYPWRRGPMRSCIIPSFIKRHGLQFWLVLAERFGMPQPFATVPPGMDHDGESSDDTIATVQAALQNLGRYWSMVVSEGVKIDHVPGSGNVSAEVHKALIEWADMTQSISMLGQNLTTKVEGGSFAAAESHRYVAGDLHLADATELASTITQQIVEPLVRYNWPGAPVPVCEIGTGAKQVPTEKDVETGIFADDERRRMMGHEAKADGSGADYRRPLTVQVPEAIGAPSVIEPALDVVAGEAIEVEPVSTNEAVAKDPSTGLNGAQLAQVQSMLAEVAAGRLPVETVKQLILASLPFSEAQVTAMLSPIQVPTVAVPAPPPTFIP